MNTVCDLCFGTGEIIDAIHDRDGGEIDQVIRKCCCIKVEEDLYESN